MGAGMKRSPIEPKAQAAGLGGVAAGIVVWVLSTYAFHSAVPAGLVSLIYAAVPGLLALGAAYVAPHQVRPGDTPVVTFNRPFGSVPSETPVTPPPAPPAV